LNTQKKGKQNVTFTLKTINYVRFYKPYQHAYRLQKKGWRLTILSIHSLRIKPIADRLLISKAYFLFSLMVKFKFEFYRKKCYFLPHCQRKWLSENVPE